MGNSEVDQLNLIWKLIGTKTFSNEFKQKLKEQNLEIKSIDSSITKLFNTLEINNIMGIATQLLEVCQNKRLTADNAIKHIFFTAEPMACDPSE